MKKYFLLISILILFGCELALDVDVPYEEKLTLNSFFTGDSLWHVDLSVNRGILDKSPFKAEAMASVFIYQDDRPVDTLYHRSDGLYYSDTGKPMYGSSYKVVAKTAAGGIVSGASILPRAIQAEVVSINPRQTSDGFESILDVKIKFDDPADTDDFYEVKVQRAWQSFINGVARVNWYDVYLKSNDPLFGDGDYRPSLIFRDVLFNGKDAEVNFEMDAHDHGDFRIRLRRVSPDYYRYVRTVQLQHSAAGDPFAQPANAYNNIENGTGIFAGYSESTYIYEAPDPVIHNFTPALGRAGDRVVINGENFFQGRRLPSVLFKGQEYDVMAHAVSYSNDRLEVIVPNGCATGPITVITSAGSGTSTSNFEVLK